jgi:CHASE2 domain-containing sensor protein
VKEPLLTDIPASVLSKPGVDIDSTLFTDKNVIIGASHQDSADIHGTPLGYMPGSLIIVNAVNSLQTKGELVSPSLITTLLIELVLLVIISVAFAMLIPSVAFILSTGFIVLVLLPITYWIFKDGVWLDFALPLFAVELHQLVSSAEHSVQQKLKNNKP